MERLSEVPLDGVAGKRKTLPSFPSLKARRGDPPEVAAVLRRGPYATLEAVEAALQPVSRPCQSVAPSVGKHRCLCCSSCHAFAM